MARMYPDIFPRAFDDGDPECLVYDALRSLPDTYVVFYSKRLQNAALFGKPECEIDFLIWNQRDVLICLEVKGGTLSYDGAQDRWLQNGVVMSKRPDRQASSACHALLSALSSELRGVNTGWALCFPQCVLLPGSSPTNIPAGRIVDESAMADLKSAIHEVENDIRSTYGKTGATPHEARRLFERLTVGIGFVTILGVRIAREAKHLIQVTGEQMEARNDLELNPHMVVHGAAGTGKTILAQEFAKRLGKRGESVLLLFYNRAITRAVRRAFERRGQVQVATFSSFAKRLIDRAFPDWWDTQSRDTADFWTLILPDKLLDVPPEHRPSFDALIVDEGQDFKPEWLQYLMTLLRDEQASRFCVFLDEHQDIFGHWQHLPASPPPFKKVLRKNCRNTKSIVSYLNQSYPTDMQVFERSPTGVAVEERVVRNAIEEQTTLVRDIKHLIINEKVHPGSIVLLLGGPKPDSSLAETKAIAGYPLESTYDGYDPTANCVYYSTIEIFKGLEADVVFVLLDDALSSVPNGSRQVYVAGSRARHVLYVYSRS